MTATNTPTTFNFVATRVICQDFSFDFVHITVDDVARLKSEIRAMEEYASFVAWLQPMRPKVLARAVRLFNEQAYTKLHGLLVPPAGGHFFLGYLQDYLEGRSLDEIRQSILNRAY